MIDFSDGSQNLRVDGSVRPADLDFWFGRSARPASSVAAGLGPRLGQMIGARTPPVRTASPQPQPAPGLPQPAAAAISDDGQQSVRPDIDGARRLLSRAGWTSRIPPTPAQKEKARQYLLRAGWDGRTQLTPAHKGKAYRLVIIDAPR
jgi:hypothetical protein